MSIRKYRKGKDYIYKRDQSGFFQLRIDRLKTFNSSLAITYRISTSCIEIIHSYFMHKFKDVIHLFSLVNT